MKSSETTTAENRRKRKYGDAVFEMLVVDVVDVSIESSENECVREESPLGNIIKEKGKQVKKINKRKSKASVSKKVDSEKEKGKDSQKRREPSKRKRETSPAIQQTSAHRPGPKGNKDDHALSKQIIVNSQHL
ncbi:hypothetical protein KY290_005260 [Solanum tuberosum]|uniref:Uncharacterized protein n=1 Tax=Solanum tuberosum TaxID=4113 RepID=A0ABQ7WDQ8_SOLTU|nr:hypothetical protein KY289_005655 [Solanum tuberosum]KAH0778833.1 hypothetical protein KY290_005260 [Solanum tuberosum]